MKKTHYKYSFFGGGGILGTWTGPYTSYWFTDRPNPGLQTTALLPGEGEGARMLFFRVLLGPPSSWCPSVVQSMWWMYMSLSPSDAEANLFCHEILSSAKL